MRRVDITGPDGAPRRVLVKEGQPPEVGIPLLELGALELPEDIEAALRRELWARDIREYADMLRPGAAAEISAALRAALKVSVSTLIQISQGEVQLLKEAGYDG
jgi:hypothetical protein